MSGLVPQAVLLCAALMALLGAAWVIALLAKHRAAPALGIVFAGVSALCVGYLAIEKFVGLGYTLGLYLSVALVVVVGLGTGLALRHTR